MSVVLIHHGPTLTKERYEDVVRRVSGGKSRMGTPADWPVEGLLVHVAGESEHGFRVVDVWESEDALRRFADLLTPILEEVGIKEQPEVYPAHTFVSA